MRKVKEQNIFKMNEVKERNINKPIKNKGLKLIEIKADDKSNAVKGQETRRKILVLSDRL